MTSEERGRLSGLIDGEGSFSSWGRIAIMFRSTDLDTVDEVAEIMRGKPGRLLKPKTAKDKPYYYTAVYGARAIYVALLIYPLVCARRKRQIEKCLRADKRIEDIARRTVP